MSLSDLDLPSLSVGDELYADGVGFRVLGLVHALRSPSPGGDGTTTGGVALLAETTDTAATRVVLRVFYPRAGAVPGAHVASAWTSAPRSENPHDGDLGSIAWIAARPPGEGFLVPRWEGVIHTHGAPRLADDRAQAAYRAAPMRVALDLTSLAKPLPFVALECHAGATVRTLLRAAAARSLALGPGFALAVGAHVTASLAALEASPVATAEGLREVWWGRVDVGSVFVTADGRCLLLPPMLFVGRVILGGLRSLQDLAELEREGDFDVPWGSTPRQAARDRWALGWVLWAIATGRPPRTVVGRPPLASTIDPQVPPALDRCIERLLALDEGRGFETAAAACAALEEARRGFDGPCDDAALAAVVRVLGTDEAGNLTLAGDGRDGTRDVVAARYLETS